MKKLGNHIEIVIIFIIFISIGNTISSTFMSGWWSCLFAMLIVNTIEKQQNL